MLLAGTYELAGAIAAAGGHSRRFAGIAGVYFVGFAGNLLVPTVAVLHAVPEPVSSWFIPVFADSLGQHAGTFARQGLSAFQYWDTVDIVPNALTLIPMYAWLNGDLHANMLSAPFVVLVGGVCYSYYRTPISASLHRGLLVFGAIPLAVGMAALTDIMTLPTSLGLVALTLSFGPVPPRTLLPSGLLARCQQWLKRVHWDKWRSARFPVEIRRIGIALGLTVLVAGAVVAITAPFLARVTGGEESVAFVSPTNRTTGIALLLVHGAFLAFFLPFLRKRNSTGDSSTMWELGAGLFFASIVLRVPAVFVIGPVLLAGVVILATDQERFEVLLIVAGAGLVIVVEFVYIASQEYVIPTRGNTVFRTYWHTWLFWGIAAGVVVPQLLRRRDGSVRETAKIVLTVALVAMTAMYGGLTVTGHFDRAFERPPEPGQQAEYVYEATQMQNHSPSPTRPPTLDGLLYADVVRPNRMAAIRWLDHHVRGTPTMVIAPGGRWQWQSAPASLTGIPTVAGSAHELLYRDQSAYYERVNHVRRIYQGPPARRIALLKKYDVQYVYVGPNERYRYDIWEFTRLDGVSTAYRNQAVAIYEINHSRLDYTPASVAPRTYDASSLGVNEAVATDDTGRIVTTATRSNRTLAWYGPNAPLRQESTWRYFT